MKEAVPGLPLCALHIAALWAMAVAQPVYDVFGSSPEILGTFGLYDGALVAWTLLGLLGGPVLLIALEAAVRRFSTGAHAILHLVLIGGLVAIFVVQARVEFDEAVHTPMLVAAPFVAAAAVFGYARRREVRSFATALVIAVPVVPILFLTTSQASGLMGAGQGSGGLPAGEPRGPLVMVLLDELPLISLLDREGDIDAARLPNFARLAERGTWFSGTAAVDNYTSFAAPAILSSTYPKWGRTPLNSDYPRNLFSLLGSRQARPLVREQWTRLCAPDICVPPGSFARRVLRAYDDLLPPIARRLLPPRASRPLIKGLQSTVGWGPGPHAGGEPGHELVLEEQRPQRWARFTQDLSALAGPAPRPRLAYLHVLLPHEPWTFLASGRRNPAPIRLSTMPFRYERDQALVDRVWQDHLEQVGFVDRLLGDLLARMEALGLDDEATLVVIADHGVSFRAGASKRSIAPPDIEAVARVPFIVMRPGDRRAPDVDTPLETVDVLPTVADALGIEIPWRVAGRSGFDPAFEGRPKLWIHDQGRNPRTYDRATLDRAHAALDRQTELLAR